MKTIYRVIQIGGGYQDFEFRNAAKYWKAQKEAEGWTCELVTKRVAA